MYDECGIVGRCLQGFRTPNVCHWALLSLPRGNFQKTERADGSDFTVLLLSLFHSKQDFEGTQHCLDCDDLLVVPCGFSDMDADSCLFRYS